MIESQVEHILRAVQTMDRSGARTEMDSYALGTHERVAVPA
ncbi:MAG: hypothetical protein ACSLFI_00085 [Solirubrobacterales bacterium]